jgi:hypothetical protein
MCSPKLESTLAELASKSSVVSRCRAGLEVSADELAEPIV